MNPITRRSFLRLLGATFGAATAGRILAACGLPPQTAATLPPATGLPAVIELPEPTAASASPDPNTPTATQLPDLVVARGGDDPEALVRRALAALGGIGRFVWPGASVIIKPNICVAYHSYEYAATTNPWVVAALVRMCREAGASRVRVLDYPFGGAPDRAYVVSGIQEQVLAAGGEMEPIQAIKFVQTDIPDGLDLKTAKIHDDILKADVVIDVPIAKTHGLAGLTLGMKNLMGVILEREAIHRNLGQRLADLASRIRPALTLIDAVRILTANGPTGGNLDDVKKLDTVVASADLVAADAYAATLFGWKPTDLSYVTAATAMGLGRSDLGALRIEEVPVGG